MAKPTLLFFTLLVSSLLCSCKGTTEAGEVKAMFVFGSSHVDNGNNNYLENSSARADYMPYGIDFALGPTGRFSNGMNSIDVLGKLLKLPSFIPPFADPTSKGSKIVHGVNYASGGSGILDETGTLVGRVVCLNQQIKNFERVTLPDLQMQVGDGLYSHLSKSIFVVGTGGNDILFNYLLGNKNVSVEAFSCHLITTFTRQLQKLHSLGARKFVILSVQTLGCAPAVRAFEPNETCAELLNNVALVYNSQLRSMVTSIKPNMRGSNLVYVNSYGIIKQIIDNPITQGFKVVHKACCETGGGFLCKKGGRKCRARHRYAFFDGLHPTDAVNVRIAKKAYASRFTSEAYPFNGLVEKEKLDSFNVPFYAPSLEIVESEIQREGSFSIETLKNFEINNNKECDTAKDIGERKAKSIRAISESLIANHFGEAIINHLFQRLGEMIADRFSKEGVKIAKEKDNTSNLVISHGNLKSWQGLWASLF